MYKYKTSNRIRGCVTVVFFWGGGVCPLADTLTPGNHSRIPALDYGSAERTLQTHADTWRCTSNPWPAVHTEGQQMMFAGKRNEPRGCRCCWSDEMGHMVAHRLYIRACCIHPSQKCANVPKSMRNWLVKLVNLITTEIWFCLGYEPNYH